MRWLLLSFSGLFWLTGGAKLAQWIGDESLAGGAPDAVLGISTRSVILLAANLELVLALVILLNRVSASTKFLLCLWLSSILLVYRTLFELAGRPSSCNCLGEVSSYLGISESGSSVIAWSIIVFVLSGSVIGLTFARKREHPSGVLFKLNNGSLKCTEFLGAEILLFCCCWVYQVFSFG
jgi:hypothetical protein